MLVRRLGIGTVEDTQSLPSWLEWVKCEERRRTLLVAFVLFNLQCIAFDVPPQIQNSEVRINLPSSEVEWTASSEQEWKRLSAMDHSPPRQFSRALSHVLSGQPINGAGPVSAFGNYALIHAIFQQVFHVRSATACFANPRDTIHIEQFRVIESALNIWQGSWDTTSESTLDPSSLKGPLGFNSVALLRLVHIRLNFDIGSSCRLISRDPLEIARAFSSGENCIRDRSPQLDNTILQCIHAFSVPVRVGIAYVTHAKRSTGASSTHFAI